MALNEMNVRLTSEHIERIIKASPQNAIKELIWNSCDADSTKIEVSFELDGFDEIKNVESVIVKDNGHGIKYEKLSELFGAFGCSDKTYSTYSPKGRIYHGKLGQGRYQSFSIGSHVKWHSVYIDDNGEKYKYTIFFDSANNMKVTFTDKEKVDILTETGVAVEIDYIVDDITHKVNQLLNCEAITKELLSTFAPYLMAYKDVIIKYDHITIDPSSHITGVKEKNIEYTSPHTEKTYLATLRLISWKENDTKKIYICGNNGVVFDELKFEENKELPVTLYILSDYYEEMHRKHTLSAGNLDDIYASFYEQAIEYFNEYMREKRFDLAQDEFLKIKDGKIYPYTGNPADDIEKVERQVFDMLALEINKVVPEFKKANVPTKRLTYRLIKEAVKTNPDSLKKILAEIFDLTPEQQDDLAKLLDYTTLPSIINTAKVVSDRLLFLTALEQMVYNDGIGKPIKERTQFHKILLQELWIFGEKYTYGVDDVSLKNVLKEYIKHLGREELIPEISDEEIENLTRIPDICLWQQYPNRYEDIENLVIELKRPTCIIGKKELDQIEDYAFKIAENTVFPKENTKWKFILLGKDFDAYTEQKLKDVKNGVGNFYNSNDGTISISVLRWNKVIQDNKLKYQFLKEKLNYQVGDTDEAVKHLRAKYAAVFNDSKKQK